MSQRVFFYVQHLLGIGHLRRAATLARALSRGGFDVLLVSGGAPVPGLDTGGARFHQLPPVRARDEGLRELSRLDGRPLDDGFRAGRAAMLVELLRLEAPDILVTEQFPFGRTQLRFELMPLLGAAKDLPKPPKIVSSVRDVLRESASASRIAQTLATFDAFFDAVLVHADPRLVALDRSFAGWEQLRGRAHYTGYVVEREQAPMAPQDTDARDPAAEVIVSVGGGAVGGPLLRAAIAARPLSSLADRRWRLLVGNNLPEAERASLSASPGIEIEPARDDFTALLARSVLSISQAGYNTVVETLIYGDRAVLVPFSTPRETEQARRAGILAERGLVQAVTADGLDGQTLAAAVDRAMAGRSIRSFPRCDANGGAATASFLASLT
ncbi:MAG: glycosyl transferase [Proteobacteria bacterium]|nr:glycosyl transferase [Pseudomonadota bacterium]